VALYQAKFATAPINKMSSIALASTTLDEGLNILSYLNFEGGSFDEESLFEESYMNFSSHSNSSVQSPILSNYESLDIDSTPLLNQTFDSPSSVDDLSSFITGLEENEEPFHETDYDYEEDLSLIEDHMLLKALEDSRLEQVRVFQPAFNEILTTSLVHLEEPAVETENTLEDLVPIVSEEVPQLPVTPPVSVLETPRPKPSSLESSLLQTIHNELPADKLSGVYRIISCANSSASSCFPLNLTGLPQSKLLELYEYVAQNIGASSQAALGASSNGHLSVSSPTATVRSVDVSSPPVTISLTSRKGRNSPSSKSSRRVGRSRRTKRGLSRRSSSESDESVILTSPPPATAVRPVPDVIFEEDSDEEIDVVGL